MNLHAPAVATFLQHLDAALPDRFVRKTRKITPARLIAVLCLMSGFGSKGYRRVVSELRTGLHRAFGWATVDQIPSPQGLAKARRSLSRETCRLAFTGVREACQARRPPSSAGYAGLRVLAIDGTRLSLPPGQALIDAFGTPANQHGPAPVAMAGLVQLWDVGANAPVDFALTGCDFHERTQAFDLFAQVGPGDLLIGDRGYPSFAIYRALCRRRTRFLLRCSQRSCKEVIDFIASGADEAVVRFVCRDLAGKRIAGTPAIPIRLLRIPLPNGQNEILATNLWQQRGHDRMALADLYTRRWTIETAFREMKVFHALEDFSATSADGIFQEVVAIQIFLLLTAEVEAMVRDYHDAMAADEPAVEQPRLRYNRLMIADAVIYLLRAAAQQPESIAEQVRIILEDVWKSRTKVRPGRSFPRLRKRPLRGYRPTAD